MRSAKGGQKTTAKQKKRARLKTFFPWGGGTGNKVKTCQNDVSNGFGPRPQQPPKEAEAQTAKIELVYQERLSQMELMVVDWG